VRGLTVTENGLVVPSGIPWDTLVARDLEECLYWLLDEMGARNLVWRQGGQGQGGPDQGRDIEATFHIESPDGGLQEERWWIEAKGRRRTLDPKPVRDALDNALNRSDVDVVVVATNTGVSNQTREWVAEWQRKHPRPRARLWDRATLERMIVKHPSVALRLFAGALSPQGRLEAIAAGFWDRLQMPPRNDLEELWRQNRTITHSLESLLAVTAGEFCNGDIAKRPWLIYVRPPDLAQLLILAMSNLPVLHLKAQYIGANSEAIHDAVLYVFMMSLLRVPDSMIVSVVTDLGKYVEPKEIIDTVQLDLGRLVVGRAYADLMRFCLSDCHRVGGGMPVASSDEAAAYWRRFHEPPAESVDEETETPEGWVWYELNDGKCGAGLKLDAEHRCPLTELDEDLLSAPCITVMSEMLIRRVRRSMDETRSVEG
jgi:hypothetical protein